MEGGRGIGAELMTDPVVLGRIQTAVGLEIVPGTPNVGIPDPLKSELLSSYLPICREAESTRHGRRIPARRAISGVQLSSQAAIGELLPRPTSPTIRRR